MAFAVAALCGGNLYDLYGALPFWDKILHTLSGPLFSIVGLSFALLLLRDMPEGTGKVLAAVLFALLFSLAVGYLWEVFEYAVDSLMPGGYNNQRWQNGVVGQLPNGNYEVTEPRGSGLIDTMSDLICNLCGTVASCCPPSSSFGESLRASISSPSAAAPPARKKPAPRPRNGNKPITAQLLPKRAALFLWPRCPRGCCRMTPVARSFRAGTAFSTA